MKERRKQRKEGEREGEAEERGGKRGGSRGKRERSRGKRGKERMQRKGRKSLPFRASPEIAAIFLEQKSKADLSTREGAGEESAEAGVDVESRSLKISISCP